MFAKTQRQVVGREGSGRGKLTNTRLEQQPGAGSLKQYKHWKRSANVTQQLYGIADSDVSGLIASQLKGSATEAVDMSVVEDLEGLQGLQVLWEILERAYGTPARKRLEERGQSMHEWIENRNSTLMEVEAQENVVLSNKQMGAKMVWTSQVLFNSGSVLDPGLVEPVLRVVFPQVHKIEKTTAQAVPFTSRRSRPKPLMRAPNERQEEETEVECEQEQDATQEEDVPEVELSVEVNFWKALRKTTATVQTRKCVVPPGQHSLLVGVPSRRRRISRKREASRKHC